MMATHEVEGEGTRESPLVLKTPPGKSEYLAYRDETANPSALVVIAGKTEVRYQLRCLADLQAMLKEHGDWMPLGSTDEQKPAAEGTVESWGRSSDNPVGGAAHRVVGRTAPALHRALGRRLLLVGTAQRHPVAVLFEHRLQIGETAELVAHLRLAGDHDESGRVGCLVAVCQVLGLAGRRLEDQGTLASPFAFDFMSRHHLPLVGIGRRRVASYAARSTAAPCLSMSPERTEQKRRRGQATPVRNLTPSLRQMSCCTWRALINPLGSPRPGATHCPTIQKPSRPGSVRGTLFTSHSGVGSQPSKLPCQLPVSRTSVAGGL